MSVRGCGCAPLDYHFYPSSKKSCNVYVRVFMGDDRNPESAQWPVQRDVIPAAGLTAENFFRDAGYLQFAALCTQHTIGRSVGG